MHRVCGLEISVGRMHEGVDRTTPVGTHRHSHTRRGGDPTTAIHRPAGVAHSLHPTCMHVDGQGTEAFLTIHEYFQ